MKKGFESIYQFKITLKEIRPPIWRRIQVPETYTFWDLHVAIQDVMGWLDYHLHQFTISHPLTGGKEEIGIPEDKNHVFDDIVDVIPGWGQRIALWFNEENRIADYWYDFGDDWHHRVELEKILFKEEGVGYPRCIKGRRACPPEDCGGTWGYENLLRIINDSEHEEYGRMMEWLGGGYDPEHFDVKEVVFTDPKKRLRRLLD